MRSIYAVRVSIFPVLRRQRESSRSASLFMARRAVLSGSFHVLAVAATGAAAKLSMAASSLSVPPLRTATQGTTAMPSAVESASGSISIPRCRAISCILSARISGLPVSFNSSTRRNVAIKCVLSATTIRSCGGVSLSRRPSTALRVISSSGLRPRKE